MPSSTITDVKREVGQVPLDQLIIDLAVQRPLDSKKSNAIAEALNLDAIGLICVSRRDSGTYSIIDGQHRVDALRIAGFTTDPVDCEIFDGLTLPDEAAMFRLRNNRSAVQKVDLFRVRVIEGDPTAVAIHHLLAKYGWTVSLGSHRGSFGAIGAIERVWLDDPDGKPCAAERTIDTVTTAWGDDSSSVDRNIIAGVGAMYLRYGFDIEVSDVIERLGKFPGGARALVGRARGLKDLIGGRLSSAVAEIVIEEYNRRRKTRGLPSWRSQ
jgi:hypothetical protein